MRYPTPQVLDAEKEMHFIQAAFDATPEMQHIHRRPDGSVNHCQASNWALHAAIQSVAIQRPLPVWCCMHPLQVKVGDSVVMIGGATDEASCKLAAAHLYILVDNVDSAYKQALDLGASAIPGQVSLLSIWT